MPMLRPVFPALPAGRSAASRPLRRWPSSTPRPTPSTPSPPSSSPSSPSSTYSPRQAAVLGGGGRWSHKPVGAVQSLPVSVHWCSRELHINGQAADPPAWSHLAQYSPLKMHRVWEFGAAFLPYYLANRITMWVIRLGWDEFAWACGPSASIERALRAAWSSASCLK